VPTYFSGLDLGGPAEHTALVSVERERVPAPSGRGPSVLRHDVRHAYRWPRGTPYPDVIADLAQWFGREPLCRGTLAVDGTGVGAAVVEMVGSAGLACRVVPFTITAGFRAGEGTVPKKDLVGAVQAALQTRRLRFAEALPLRPVLEKELEAFRAGAPAGRDEHFADWREREHDDLVLALALAVWHGEQGGSGEVHTDFADPLGDLPAGTFGRRELPRDTFA
jgi:hypothetical protein